MLQSVEKEVLPGKLASGKFGAGDAKYKIVVDSPAMGVEKNYFDTLRLLEKKPPYGLNYVGNNGRIEKIRDIYTSGETSAYWGAVEQRKGAQQDKFAQIMANIGQMLKTLFQLLRELRIIDERLQYYDDSYQGKEASEIALKSIWVDMVEGGIKNPGSVTGLTSQVGFVTLADLFYSIHPKKPDDVEEEVEKVKEGGINRKVREVLARKLKQYLIWKEKTYRELKVGQSFKLKYLRQHYHVIKLYLNWLRPYLRNIKRLQQKETTADKDIIAAFETSKVEIEIIAIKFKYEQETSYGNTEEKEFQKFFPAVRVRINFTAIPQLAYQEEFQRGAIHRGRSEIIIEGLVITEDEYEKYKKELDKEDFELLGAVDEAILSLKDDLEYYLEKAGEIKKEEEIETRETVIDPFKALFTEFKEIFGIRGKKEGKKIKAPKTEEEQAKKIASNDAYTLYKIFKQTHGMITE